LERVIIFFSILEVTSVPSCSLVEKGENVGIASGKDSYWPFNRKNQKLSIKGVYRAIGDWTGENLKGRAQRLKAEKGRNSEGLNSETARCDGRKSCGNPR